MKTAPTTKKITETTREITSTTMDITSTTMEITEPTREITPAPMEINETTKEITSTIMEITEPTREVTPTPMEINETTREITPTPKEITEPTSEVTETTREITPTTWEITEPSREITQAPNKVTETTRELAPTPSTPTLEDIIHVRCNEFSWDVKIHLPRLKQLYPNIRPADIYLGDNSCIGVEMGDKLLFQQGLRQCLTAEQTSGSAMVYTNNLIYAVHDPVHPFIVRQFNWTFTVECDVSRDESATAHLHHSGATGGEQHGGSVAAHHNMSLAFYSDVNFMHIISGNPVKVKVGDYVYVKVFTASLDWMVKMRVHTCYTKPATTAPEDMKYYLIKDGCEMDTTTHIISQYPHETRFVFREFEYSTNHEGMNIYCHATFCETSDLSQACLQTCSPDAH